MNKGQNLFEFVLIIALVAIAGLLAYSLLGQNINDMFNKSHGEYKKFKPFDWGQSNTQATNNTGGSTGPIKGTPENPVKTCTGNICSLDMGPFTLNGIPADFSDFVQSNGSSGGVNQLASIMEQLADQLEQQGDSAGAQEFRDLANLTHFTAANQKKAEAEAEKCKTSADPNCIISVLNSNFNNTIPPELASIIPNYNQNDLLRYNFTTDLGYARDFKTSNPGLFATWEKKNPNLAMIDKFDTIMNNSNFSDQLKGITQELVLSVNDLMLGMNHRTGGEDCPTITNPVTGVQETYTKKPDSAEMYSLSDITNPQTSVNTNLDGSLICASGWNKDTGFTCHK